MKQHRSVIIGCGSRAAAHIEAYRHIDNAKIVACAAPTAARRDAVAAKYSLTPYADAREMITKEKPDCVHIVTWPDTRVELMTLVSEMNVPLCTTEKPLATSIADYKALCALADRTRTKFAVCHQMRWQKDLIVCREAIAAESIGTVPFIDISCGMNIAGQGTHTLNYGRSLIGDPKAVTVFGSTDGWDDSDPGHPAPLSSEAYITFDNGVRALWTSGPVSPRAGDTKTTWQHIRIGAYGTKGRALWEEFGKWEIEGSSPRVGDFGGMDTWKKENSFAQARFHQAMFSWLEDDSKVPGTSFKDSLHECAVIFALYQSSVEHRPISMDGFVPPDDLIERIRS